MTSFSSEEPAALAVGVVGSKARARRRAARPAAGWAASPGLLVAPAILFYIVFFGLPVAGMVWQSVWSDGLTLAGYREFLSEPAYWRILAYTMVLGFVTLLVTLAVGYPVAYWLVTIDRTWTVVLMAFVLIPFWSSSLVRTYAWIVILGRQGLVNTLLKQLGWISEPIPFVGTHFAVVVALAYFLLPYMILTLYSVMNNIDRRLLLAAQNLGASPARAFLHVFVPLTKPGVFAGSFLVFMLAIGMYITPALLGGPEQLTLPLVIAIQVNEALDWTFASALSVILLVFTGAMQVAARRYVDFDRMWGGAR